MDLFVNIQNFDSHFISHHMHLSIELLAFYDLINLKQGSLWSMNFFNFVVTFFHEMIPFRNLSHYLNYHSRC